MAKANNLMVCATQVDGEWVYWTMPPDATNEQVLDEVFLRREGRRLNAEERLILRAGERLHA